MLLNTYLTFSGNCREAFDFYRSVFGGEFDTMQTFADGPPDMDVPPKFRGHVLHVSLPIGSSTLMGSDTGPGQPAVFMGDNFSVSVSPDSRADCDRLFAGISADGAVTMPLQEMFWGAYFGTCKDKFGINWMFNFESAP